MNQFLAALRFLRRLATLEKRMDQFQTDIDKLTQNDAAMAKDVTTAKTGILGLQQQITDLNATIKTLQPGPTPDQQAALDKAVAQSDALKASADDLVATLTPPPASSTPPAA